jgi:hypothetical protein
MAVRLSAVRTSRTLLPRSIIIFMFLVLISVRDKPDELQNSPANAAIHGNADIT